MSAIVTALRETTITRLELTYNQLPKKAKRMVEGMEALLDPRDNHSAYMATLNSSNNLPCIPLLDEHLTY